MTSRYDTHQSNYLPHCLNRFFEERKIPKTNFWPQRAERKRNFFSYARRKPPKLKETYWKRLGVCDGVESLTPEFHSFFLTGALFVTAVKLTIRVFGVSGVELTQFDRSQTRSRSHIQLQDNHRAMKHFITEKRFLP